MNSNGFFFWGGGNCFDEIFVVLVFYTKMYLKEIIDASLAACLLNRIFNFLLEVEQDSYRRERIRSLWNVDMEKNGKDQRAW